MIEYDSDRQGLWGKLHLRETRASSQKNNSYFRSRHLDNIVENVDDRPSVLGTITLIQAYVH